MDQPARRPTTNDLAPRSMDGVGRRQPAAPVPVPAPKRSLRPVRTAQPVPQPAPLPVAVPPATPVAPPARRSRRWLRVTLMVIAWLLVVAAVAAAVVELYAHYYQ